MIKTLKKLTAVLLLITTLFGLCSCFEDIGLPDIDIDIPGFEQTEKTKVVTNAPITEEGTQRTKAEIDKDGSYTTASDVALYIHTYGKLPQNFITKSEAQALGWDGGSLEKYAKGKCIGGDKFSNYEGILPKKSGRYYTECDIDTLGKKSRGSKRIVFSNDGLIFYTEDHYETFTQLY